MTRFFEPYFTKLKNNKITTSFTVLNKGWEGLLAALAGIILLPTLIPGIIFPYWWLATYKLYDIHFPPLAPLNHLAFAVSLIAAIVLTLKYHRSYGIFVLAALLHAAIVAVADTNLFAPGTILPLYIPVCFAGFVLLGYRFGIASTMFPSMLVLLGSAGWIDGLSLLLTGSKLLEFAINFIIARLTAKVLVQNAKQLSQLTNTDYVRILARTFALWMPVMLAAAVGIFLNHLMNEHMVRTAYNSGLVVDRPAGEGQTPKRDLYKDISYSIDHRFGQLDANTERVMQEARANAATLPETLPGIAVREYDLATPPPPLIGGDPCPSGGVTGILLRRPCQMIVSAVNRSYEDYRNRKREVLRAEMTRIAIDTQLTAEEKIERAGDRYAKLSHDLKNDSKALLFYNFNGFVIFSYLLNLVFFFVLVKSFLLVLGRVAYSAGERASFTISPQYSDGKQSRNLHFLNPRGDGQRLTLRKGRTESFHLINNHQWDQTAGDIKIPPKQPFDAFFARLGNKSYLLNHLDLQKVRRSPALKVEQPKRIVAIKLRKNQTVAFKFKDFAGISENAELRSNFDPNIALFCLGRRFFYTTATGPGTLLLFGQGAINTASATQRSPVAVQRLLAFDVTERFKLDSTLNWPNVYLNAAYVQPMGQLAIVDSRKIPQPGFFGQIWRLISFIVLPW